MAILSEHVRKSLIRVIPGAFVFGAAIEWFMINVSVGQETFYDVATRKQIERMQEVVYHQEEADERTESAQGDAAQNQLT
mmetsp:Transcript_39592/g.157207  ORF Transcript_39592/g.157207 Transcript_39592/m.157207 type:complete len:80 (-) Transcript_39592:5136-5375(-)|eukprot:CAMPEP_0113956762 /NCGR_PEP_ID=MMETSP0011_2-20120614/2271_1 /TAXON_ID=101924 /ORGANISM="Rhodosorus marinus" /LENGTH=79 /DNA_ID=CAMNT_0000967003 /DNA_START=180 /DNA_END=419 /DNA_ORIENTATION=- /assembly_acc=CAM_ASM_000156